MRPKWWCAATALVVGALSVGFAVPADAQHDPGAAVDAAARVLASESVTPFGANDWSCESGDKPPVVLVHGAAGDDGGQPPSQLAFASLIPRLRAEGYCVFAADLNNSKSLYYRRPAYDDPQRLVDTIADERAPTQLDVFVAGVQRASGARQVSLIGHSLGAPIARAYMRGGNIEDVDDLITLGGTNLHLDDVWEESPELAGDGQPPSVREIFGADGGAFLDWLNGADHELETDPSVSYTALGLNNESLVARPFFAASGGNVSNYFFGPQVVHLDQSRMPTPQCILVPFTCDRFDVFEERAYLRSDDYAVRRVCPAALVDDGGVLRHSLWAFNPQAQRVVLAALESEGPAPSDLRLC